MKDDRTTGLSWVSIISWLAIPLLLIAALIRQYKPTTNNLVDIAPAEDSSNIFDASVFDQNCADGLYEIKKVRYQHALSLIDVGLEARLEGDEAHLQRAWEYCNKALKQILLSKSTFHANFIDKPLRIVLIPKSMAFGKASYGMYNHVHRQIAIVYRQNGSLAHYRKAISDEFFHHQLLLHDEHEASCGSTNMTVALHQATERVQRLTQLFRQEVDIDNSASYSKALKKLFGAAKSYGANTFDSDDSLLEKAVALKIMTTPNKKGEFFTGPYADPALPKIYGKTQAGKRVYSYGRDKTALGRAEAMLGDLTMIHNQLTNPRGPYATMSAKSRQVNWVSFLSQYGAQAQKLIAPEVSNILCQQYQRKI